MKNDTSFDVGVVGTGPAGLAAAVALAGLGPRIVAVGQAPAKRDTRTAALFAGSITLLENLGVGVVCRQTDHRQAQRRVFVGPMPERVAVSASGNQGAQPRDGSALGARRATQESDDALSTTSSTSGTIDGVDQEHALAFFVAEGGREEDFGGQERGVRKEIRKRLKESRWMPLLGKSEVHSRSAASRQKW